MLRVSLNSVWRSSREGNQGYWKLGIWWHVKTNYLSKKLQRILRQVFLKELSGIAGKRVSDIFASGKSQAQHWSQDLDGKLNASLSLGGKGTKKQEGKKEKVVPLLSSVMQWSLRTTLIDIAIVCYFDCILMLPRMPIKIYFQSEVGASYYLTKINHRCFEGLSTDGETGSRRAALRAGLCLLGWRN